MELTQWSQCHWATHLAWLWRSSSQRKFLDSNGKVNPPSVFLKTLLILNFQHYSDVNQWISIGPLGRICNLLPPYLGFPSSSVVKNSPANAGDEGDAGSTLGFGRSFGAGNGNSLQYSCLRNHMDRGAWWATVHRVTKSQTQLKRLSTQHVVLTIPLNGQPHSA